MRSSVDNSGLTTFEKIWELIEIAESRVSVVAHLETIPHIKRDLKTAELALQTAMRIIDDIDQ